MTQSEFDSALFPVVKQIFSRTIGMDLGFATQDEINEVKSRVTRDNRDGKIESILDDKPFIEKKIEDDPEYKDLMKKGTSPLPGPSPTLFYMDFIYGSTQSI